MSEKKVSKLTFQYPLTQFLYWTSCCACVGFVAVYLQYKGFSNTIVGIVVGIYGVLSLVLQPLSSKLVQQISFLTVRKMLLFLLLLASGMFAVISFFPMAGWLTIVLFILVSAINNSLIPLLNSLGMEYINQNRKVDFGLARGAGSLGWALSAVAIGALLEKYSPDLLGYIYVVSALAMFVNLLFMEDLGHEVNASVADVSETMAATVEKPVKKESGAWKACLSDKTFLFVALGMALANASHSICTTYTIDIVRNVGGMETAAGLAQFFGAGAEVFGMILFSRLIKKHSYLKMLKVSSIFFAVRFFFLIFANSLPLVMLGYVLQAPSAGFYFPAVVYFVNERMLPENRTQGQAFFNTMTSGIAGFLGNIIGGRMLDLLGLKATLVTCFVFAAVGCVCVLTRKEERQGNVYNE